MNKRRVGAFLMASMLAGQQIPLAGALVNQERIQRAVDKRADNVAIEEIKTEGTQTEDSADSINTEDSQSTPDETFPFDDVSEGSAYYDAVYSLWSAGVLKGGPYFHQDNIILLEEAAELAIRAYELDSMHSSEPESYVKQAVEYGLIPEGTLGNPRVDTETMLHILTQLEEPLEPLREVRVINGLSETDEDYNDIYALYRAGVFSGSDENGSLNRTALVSRGEFVLTLGALLFPELRSSEVTGTGTSAPSQNASEAQPEVETQGTTDNTSDAGETPDNGESSEEPERPTGLAAFEPIPESTNPFTDISPENSMYESIMGMYGLGLMNGVTETAFYPKNTITAAQFTVIAVRAYEKYRGLNTDFTPPQGVPWYEAYMKKADEYKLLPSGLSDYTKPLSRRQAFYIMYRVFPETELVKKRSVFRLPDLSPADVQYKEIIAIYEAGIASGSDEYGTFEGGRSITRAESATLMYKLIHPASRSSNELKLVGGMEAFKQKTGNLVFPFTDIDSKAWYAGYVRSMYNLGLMNGVTATTYSPLGSVSLAEAITLAVRVYEYYHGLAWSSYEKNDPPGTPWYMKYVELGKSYGLVDEKWSEFKKPVRKDELAYLVYHCFFSSETCKAINNIELKEIPDVDEKTQYHNEIFSLYNAGVMSGEKPSGEFYPTSSATRALVASVFSRLLYPDTRLKFIIKPDLTGLMRTVQSAISGYYGTWSVYFCDVKSGADFVINDRRMWAASVVKLYVMATVLEAIEKGTLKDSYAVQSDLREMITVSSNTAWTSLYSRLGGGNANLGRTKVNEFCKRNGYPDSGRLTSAAPYNSTSAKDTGLFLLRMLKGVNVSEAASKQMLTLMKAQQRKWKIPAGVPSGIVTANKTGELFNATPVENDAAVVFAPSGTYILVVLTQNGSVNNVKKLSSIVYNYLNH